MPLGPPSPSPAHSSPTWADQAFQWLSAHSPQYLPSLKAVGPLRSLPHWLEAPLLFSSLCSVSPGDQGLEQPKPWISPLLQVPAAIPQLGALWNSTRLFPPS